MHDCQFTLHLLVGHVNQNYNRVTEAARTPSMWWYHVLVPEQEKLFEIVLGPARPQRGRSDLPRCGSDRPQQPERPPEFRPFRTEHGGRRRGSR